MSPDQQENTNKLRSWVAVAVVACYLVPLVFLTLYNTSLLPLNQGWPILTIGLIGALGGGIILFLLMRQWEEAFLGGNYPYPASPMIEIPAEVPNASVTQQAIVEEVQRLTENLSLSQSQREALGEELHTLQQTTEGLQREKELLEHQCSEANQLIQEQQTSFDEQLKSKETRLEEYQQTILDQRTVIEKKQQQIAALESQVQDLKYELKTLVDLSETFVEEVETSSPPPASPKQPEPTPKATKAKSEKVDAVLDLGLAVPSRSTEEAQQQLKRCIDIAQKLTGARHLAGDSARFRDLSADGFALDLRRLCDSLRSEQSSMILLYSQRESKALFVNDQVRGLLRWNADKFLQNFPGIICDIKEWRSAIQKAASSQRSESLLKMKTRSGEEASVRCLLGNIPTGIFKTHLIGVFYPAE